MRQGTVIGQRGGLRVALQRLLRLAAQERQVPLLEGILVSLE